jgi:hypothetical protein
MSASDRPQKITFAEMRDIERAIQSPRRRGRAALAEL